MTFSDPDFIEVPLANGEKALIDASDADRVLEHRWCKCAANYAGTKIRGLDGVKRVVLMHRFLLGITDSRLEVDHINRDGLDNRKANLRAVSHATNMANIVRKPSRKYAYKGITGGPDRASGRGYTAVIRAGKRHYLGSFRTEIEAARAYDRAAIRIHGEYARTNFPHSDYADDVDDDC